MESKEKIWESVLEIIKENVTDICYSTWFKPLRIRRIDLDLNIIYMEINPNHVLMMKKESIISIIKNRYISTLQNAFKKIMNENFRVVIKCSEEYDKEEGIGIGIEEESEEIKYFEEDNIEEIIQENSEETGIKNKGKNKDLPKIKVPKKELDKQKIFNPKYNFENFVVGSSNKYAHAAALAVAESPSEAYNPLFIYGGSGLGKTHLMHAMGIYLIEKNPDINVLYVSSEMFTNELIKAISEHKMNEFKLKYRKVDVLLIDDIQFLEGKENTQEEFFHTFNTLYDLNRQIIISSDRPPNKLVNLEERLRSRFQWNLIADIQPADYETRVAILMKKAENLNINVTDDLYDVICLIAEKIKDNIRELEGAFTRIVSFSHLLGENPDKAFAKRILRDILSNGEIAVTPEKIKKVVCKHYGIKLSDLESSKKTNNIAFPRQVAMYLIRNLTDFSLPKIGEYFGGKHYTTVMYACEKIEEELKIDKNLNDLINELKNEIKD